MKEKKDIVELQLWRKVGSKTNRGASDVPPVDHGERTKPISVLSE
jgi:hypothetical protein